MIFEYRYYFCICPYVYKNDWNIVFLVNYLLQIWSLKDFTIKKLLILVKEEVNTILQLSLCRKAININVSDLVSLLYILLLLNNFLSAIQVWKKKKTLFIARLSWGHLKYFCLLKFKKSNMSYFPWKWHSSVRESLYCLNFQLTNQLCHYWITEVIALIHYKWKIKQ